MLPKGTTMAPVDANGVAAEWVVPASAIAGAAVLHLHGGGYVSGSYRLERLLTSGLADAAQARVLVPDYRLAPEHPFPAALDDAHAAYQFLLDAGYRADRMVVSGDSAGGGLAVALALRLRDAGEPLPAAMVMMSPWADLELKNPSCTTKAGVESLLRIDILEQWAEWYADGIDRADPFMSPVNGRLAGLPPMLIQVGSEEMPARRCTDSGRQGHRGWRRRDPERMGRTLALLANTRRPGSREYGELRRNTQVPGAAVAYFTTKLTSLPGTTMTLTISLPAVYSMTLGSASAAFELVPGRARGRLEAPRILPFTCTTIVSSSSAQSAAS